MKEFVVPRNLDLISYLNRLESSEGRNTPTSQLDYEAGFLNDWFRTNKSVPTEDSLSDEEMELRLKVQGEQFKNWFKYTATMPSVGGYNYHMTLESLAETASAVSSQLVRMSDIVSGELSETKKVRLSELTLHWNEISDVVNAAVHLDE